MTERAQIRNIIFDFGGVLFEIDYDLPIKAFIDLGYADFANIYTQASQNDMFDKLETGKVSNEEFMTWLHAFVPVAERKAVAAAFNTILLHIMPEQVEVVRQLRESGYRTFLFSNTNAIHVTEFERMTNEVMGIENFKSAFDMIYYSNVVGLKKPYPETFLKICEWNDLKPSETLFIDDSIQHVEGAIRAGLRGYHLKPGERLTDVMKDILAGDR